MRTVINKRHRSAMRSIFAILLLMVMLIQMGEKTFHLHRYSHDVEFSCSDCEHHRMHSGHILEWSGHADDCPLCQMLASPYLPALEYRVPLPFVSVGSHGITYIPCVAEAQWCLLSSRAPPSVYYDIVA